MSGTKMRLIRQGAMNQDWVDQEIIVDSDYLVTHPDLYITLDISIQLGIGQLDVYFNGHRLNEGIDYFEIDNQTILLDLGTDVEGNPIPLQVGDVIFIRNWINRYFYHENSFQGPPTAEMVGYLHPDYPAVTNVKKALDKLLDITKVMVFVFPGPVKMGTQRIELSFPFKGEVVNVVASLIDPGETNTSIQVQRISSEAYFAESDTWINIMENPLLIEATKKSSLNSSNEISFVNNEVNPNDYFRIVVISEGADASDLTVEVTVKLV